MPIAPSATIATSSAIGRSHGNVALSGMPKSSTPHRIVATIE